MEETSRDSENVHVLTGNEERGLTKGAGPPEPHYKSLFLISDQSCKPFTPLEWSRVKKGGREKVASSVTCIGHSLLPTRKGEASGKLESHLGWKPVSTRVCS